MKKNLVHQIKHKSDMIMYAIWKYCSVRNVDR